MELKEYHALLDEFDLVGVVDSYHSMMNYKILQGKNGYMLIEDDASRSDQEFTTLAYGENITEFYKSVAGADIEEYVKDEVKSRVGFRVKDHVAVVLVKSKVYSGSGDVYVKVSKEQENRLETIRTFVVDTGYCLDTYEIITGTGKIVSTVEDWVGGRIRTQTKEYNLKGRINYKVCVADEINRSKWSEFVRIHTNGLCSVYVGFEPLWFTKLYKGSKVSTFRLNIYVPGKWKLFDTDKKKLPANTVVAYLLNDSIKVPDAEYPFEIFGCKFDIPKGLDNEPYMHYASGTYQNWIKLFSRDAAPENCKNDGIGQSYFYVTDGTDTYLLRRWWLDRGYILTLVMPGSQYGAPIATNNGNNKMLMKIHMGELSYLKKEHQFIHVMEYEDFWVGIRILPDGRYQLEEWSDSSSENDKWVLESVDECLRKASELYGEPISR